MSMNNVFRIAPPTAIDRALPQAMADWIVLLPETEKGRALDLLPDHRAAVVLLLCEPAERGRILGAVEPERIHRLARILSDHTLRESVPYCSVQVCGQLERTLQPARRDRIGLRRIQTSKPAAAAVSELQGPWQLSSLFRTMRWSRPESDIRSAGSGRS